PDASRRPHQRRARPAAPRRMTGGAVARGWRSAATWIGAAIVGAALALAVLAPLIVPHDPFAQDLNHRLLPPFWMDGTDAAHLLAVVATLEMALAILLEAALSFLGLGVPPPLPSWGLMIAEAKDYMFFSPWVIMLPGCVLFVLVLGVNLLGDGLRDLLGARD